jgi:hypothetical protein
MGARERRPGDPGSTIAPGRSRWDAAARGTEARGRRLLRGLGGAAGALLLLTSLTLAGVTAAAPRVVWTRSIDGAGEDDSVYGVAFDGSGSVYVAGCLDPDPNGGGPFAMLRRYTASGVLQWEDRYEGPEARACGRGVAVDTGGRAYLVGEVTGPRETPASILLAYSPSGRRLWARYVEGVVGRGLAVGGRRLAVVGARSGAGRGYEAWVGVYTLRGRAVWTRSFGGPAGKDDFALGVAVGADGSLYVAGYLTTSASPWNEDLFVRRYSSHGSLIWTRLPRDQAGDYDHAQAVAVRGRFLYVGGIVDGSEGGPRFGDAWLRRLTTGGRAVWTRRWGGSAGLNDDVAGVAVDADGNVYAAGDQVDKGIEGNGNLFLRSYSPAGELRWRLRYDGGADDYGTSVAVQDSRLAVGAYRWAGATSLDGWVRVYAGLR